MLFESSIVFPNVEKHILENNIFGVDINEESVEIARLSLWLRTAQKGRKLSSLSSNIKVGNSLIDDPAVAGELAFNWEKEFPQVFAKGGFDVVVGNPPYLRVQGLRTNFEVESKFYESNFESATGRFDIYALFIEKVFKLISTDGKVCFILPHKFLVSDFGSGIRSFLVNNRAVESIINFGSEMVFQDASTYTCIITLSQNNSSIKFKQINPLEIFNQFKYDQVDLKSLSSGKWNLFSNSVSLIIDKLAKQKYVLSDVFDAISTGIDSGVDDLFILKGEISGHLFRGFSNKANQYIEIEKDLVKPILKGKDIKRYSKNVSDHYVIYPHYLKNGKTVPYNEQEMIKKFPLAYNYFLPFKNELIELKIRKKTNPKYWYSLHRSREISLFESNEKIITPEISLGSNMSFDANKFYHNTKCYSLLKKEELKQDYKYLLGILNSKVMWFFLLNTGYILRGGFFTFKTKFLEPFPIPIIEPENQIPIIIRVELMLGIKTEFELIQTLFLNHLISKFNIEKPSTKFQNWPTLDFKGFLGELAKAKVKLSLSEEADWMAYFHEQKAKALALQSDISRLDAEIDQLVYELYGLTEEEIRIVEGGEG
jgi:hypothetical protein